MIRRCCIKSSQSDEMVSRKTTLGYVKDVLFLRYYTYICKEVDGKRVCHAIAE